MRLPWLPVCCGSRCGLGAVGIVARGARRRPVIGVRAPAKARSNSGPQRGRPSFAIRAQHAGVRAQQGLPGRSGPPQLRDASGPHCRAAIHRRFADRRAGGRDSLRGAFLDPRCVVGHSSKPGGRWMSHRRRPIRAFAISEIAKLSRSARQISYDAYRRHMQSGLQVWRGWRRAHSEQGRQPLASSRTLTSRQTRFA